MARSLSSNKRMRQNAKRAARNKIRKTTIKTAVSQVKDALTAKDAPNAEKSFRNATKVLDRNAARGTIHRNTAARRKSRLAKRINALKSGAKA